MKPDFTANEAPGRGCAKPRACTTGEYRQRAATLETRTIRQGNGTLWRHCCNAAKVERIQYIRALYGAPFQSRLSSSNGVF
tara:strand:- start:160 stop:402 length:243 start_codon:yes stop_codon:yes gene_type:complete